MSSTSDALNQAHKPTDLNLPSDLLDQVKAALKEDIGPEDITAKLIPENKTAKAKVIAREAAIVCGLPWFNAVFAQIDPTIECHWQITEGDSVQPDQVILELHGNARSILTAERTALNFLQSLSGTATTTHAWTQIIANTQTQLLDTRKTLPGLRTAQKYAVRIGGGANHRMGLYDQFLIKENHIMAAGGITQAIAQAKLQHPNITVEVEVENLEEFDQALNAGADVIMLDNFQLQDIKHAVSQREAAKKVADCKLEASGGVDETVLLTLAETGIDYISVGALTKHVRAIDFSMRFTLEP